MSAFVPYSMTDQGINLFINGRPYSVDYTHPNFDRIKQVLRAKRFDDLLSLVDIPRAIASWSEGNVTVIDEKVQYKNRVVHGVITKRIIGLIEQQLDPLPLMRFLDKLHQNPSKTAIDELYGWLENGQFSIAEDGDFFAYKYVLNDYTSEHTSPDGTRLDNSIGKTVEMDRSEVNDDRRHTCSQGLHFCSFAYLPKYGDGGWDGNKRVLIMKINPADVVSIPYDHNEQKGRCCRYVSWGELDRPENVLEENPIYGQEPVDEDDDEDNELVDAQDNEDDDDEFNTPYRT